MPSQQLVKPLTTIKIPIKWRSMDFESLYEAEVEMDRVEGKAKVVGVVTKVKTGVPKIPERMKIYRFLGIFLFYGKPLFMRIHLTWPFYIEESPGCGCWILGKDLWDSIRKYTKMIFHKINQPCPNCGKKKK